MAQLCFAHFRAHNSLKIAHKSRIFQKKSSTKIRHKNSSNSSLNATFLDDFQSLCRKQNFFQDHCSMVRKKLYQEKNMRYIGQEREKKVEKYCDDRKGGDSTQKKILFSSYLCNVQVHTAVKTKNSRI